MKTNELIKVIEELGLESFLTDEVVGVKESHGWTIAEVSRLYKYQLDTDWESFKELKPLIKNALFDAISLYSITPIDKREEPKRYIYRLTLDVAPGIVDGVLIPSNKEYFIVDDSISGIRFDGSARDYVKAADNFHFTDDEIESLPDEKRNLIQACEKIPVNEL